MENIAIITGNEIERKFIINESVMKKLSLPKPLFIEQDYLATGEEEVRIRSVKPFYEENSYVNKLEGEEPATFVMTIKSGAGMIRTENEFPILKKTYEQLKTVYTPIQKIRYKIPMDNVEVELDKYVGDLAGLIIAEVEFDSKESAEAFIIPEWFGKEVTEDIQYKNQKLWKKINK